ncbi:transmembrane protease serine 12-like isoform X3 [Lacerta agilis]|uniref:transmembrane protease serine 12-like isoform X3 n=1 Tax=Lacerta agilis TaxID=80427 RepID=UPI001419E8F6|nr:transmembrane protease serine 12-like isoform X3 [Lacerta agilis]
MRRSLHPAARTSLVLLALLYGPLPGALPSKLPEHECGRRPLVDETAEGSRIIGGHDAQLGAWPWSPESWRAVIGLHHLYKPHSRTVIQKVSTITIHSDFEWGTFENDVALFQLAKSVKYNAYIQPICLPDTSPPLSHETSCYISGWGSTYENGKAEHILQEAQVNIIPQQICNKFDWYAGAVSLNMLCAGTANGSVDSCQGDSGGPLMCSFLDDTYYLIGITSSGVGCGRPQLPGIYIRAANYRSWIDSHVFDKTTTVSIQFVLIFSTAGWVTFHLIL